MDTSPYDRGVPDFFSSAERLLAQMFMGFGRYIPSISVPKMIEKMQRNLFIDS